MTTAPAQDHAHAAATRVLVIDDDAAYRTTLRAQLERAGCEVVETGNGATGLELCRTEKPSVILLDAELPIMNGAEFLRTQQADARIMYIPTIAISAGDLALGGRVVRQLRKPVSEGVLIEIIRVVVGTSRRWSVP